ncbi:hypothetical protein BKA61DRAFT_683658 [Leptodontidium sp. MPI-SDFR-AT-0119]|nr:hypothetical protein BKA61DRAFT_683658 [Leptodontidium sp. MPI-SDFR-AT-0119]
MAPTDDHYAMSQSTAIRKHRSPSLSQSPKHPRPIFREPVKAFWVAGKRDIPSYSCNPWDFYELVRFNFDLDVLYLDISQEEDSLYRLFRILKETKLARLKYAAIDEAYLGDGLAHYSTFAGLKNAMRAMTNLKETIVVRDITNDTSDDKAQMAFYAERRLGQDEAGWPVSVEELPDVQKEYAGWKLSQTVKMAAVYGWRAR